jgi:hypothetical protein
MTPRLERDGEACKITSTYVFNAFIIAHRALFYVMVSALGVLEKYAMLPLKTNMT